jgi:hypothetical protein
MPAKIDELQLQIEADASGAIRQLGNLSVALKQVADRADGLKSAASGLNDFAKAVDNMADAKVTKSVHRLQKLASIDYSNLRTGAQSVNLLANSLSQLGNVNIDTKGVNKFASSIKDMQTVASSGGKSPIDRAYTTAMYTAGDAIKTVTGHALQLGGKGASALANFASRMGMIPRLSGGVDRTALSFGNLLRTITPFIGLRGLFGWAQDAVKTGSSIVEVENVIDTSFGNMKKGYEDISGYIYKWAQTTIDGFGVSELAAKQYAGRLMSMFNSSGFDATEGMRDSAAKMSTELIERAGDIASFYDITVDEAMTKIQSGLAGVTRPLRSLGINMTVANMQAYALSQGITTSWQSMDQATQMMLRYNYILDASKYAMGDFSRTANTYANQVRLLSLNFQVLSSTIGQGLISAIAPIISWLNLLIKRLIQAANAFRTFMFSLFGKAIGAAKGVSNDLADYLGDANDSVQDLGGGAGNAADGLGSAGKAAKDLKKQLTVLPFDELNQLAKDTEAASSGGGGGGGGGGAGGGGLGDIGSLLDMSEMDLSGSPVIDAVNKWAEKMRKAFIQGDWTKLGHTIAEGLNSGFQKIYEVLDWKKVGPKVYGFIQPFQATINSMMNKINWDLIGRTFARGLNDIVYTFRMFINGFNWREYGKQFATGMNGFLSEWDSESFGRAIADKFRAAWNWFGGWVEKFNFRLLGVKLKKLIIGALDEMNWSDMGSSLGKLLTGIGTTLSTMFEDGEIREKFSTALSDFVNGFLEDFDSEEFMRGLKAAAKTIIGGLGDAIKKVDKTKLKEDVTTLLKELPWDSIGTAVATVAGAKLATKIFGFTFKKVAEAKISSIFGGGAVSAGGGAASSAGASAAGGAATAAGLTVSQLSIVGAISVGGIALGLWLKKQADESGLTKLFQLDTAGNKSNAAKTTSEGQTKNQQALNAAGINNAGYSTKIQTVPNQPSAPSAPKSTATTNVVTMVMKGIEDSSFVNVKKGVAEIGKYPTYTKTMYGKDGGKFERYVKDLKDTNNYKTEKYLYATDKNWFVTGHNYLVDQKPYATTKQFKGHDVSNFIKYHGYQVDTGAYQATKKFRSDASDAFTTNYSRLADTRPHQANKAFRADASDSFKKNYARLADEGNHTADKWFKATDKGNFTNYSNILNNLPSKKSINVEIDVESKVKEVVANIAGGGRQVIASFQRIFNAKGGLFDKPAAYQVFGEAGAEAAIPLERKSTLRRIGSAISEADGMSGSSELASEIANNLAPIIIQAMSSQQQRPINVNATLYTENNEVLARAVNQGNRNLDKRYNPVSQFAFS